MESIPRTILGFVGSANSEIAFPSTSVNPVGYQHQDSQGNLLSVRGQRRDLVVIVVDLNRSEFFVDDEIAVNVEPIFQ